MPRARGGQGEETHREEYDSMFKADTSTTHLKLVVTKPEVEQEQASVTQ